MDIIGLVGGHCVAIQQYAFAGFCLSGVLFLTGAYIKDSKALPN